MNHKYDIVEVFIFGYVDILCDSCSLCSIPTKPPPFCQALPLGYLYLYATILSLG